MFSNSVGERRSKAEVKAPTVSEIQLFGPGDVPDALETSLRLGPPAMLFGATIWNGQTKGRWIADRSIWPAV